MKEKLIIRNFGPIREVELELSRFNVLIGEQATGKSTVAKLLAVCRYFSYIIPGSHALDFPFMEGLRHWGLLESVKESSFIYYENADYSFEAAAAKRTDRRTDDEGDVADEVQSTVFLTKLVSRSDAFKRLMVELQKLSPEPDASLEKALQLNEHSPAYIPNSFFKNDVSRVMNNPFYLPTERGLQSIFSLGKNSIQNISDSLFNQLAEIDQISRSFTSETKIAPLNIVYKNSNGRGFVRKEGETNFYSLYNAASGYQSTIPITLASIHYSELKKKKTFIVEEPEMNLFPSAQRKLIQFLVDRLNRYGHSVFITTHSPYVLTSINNLIEGYKAGEEHPQEASEVIPKNLWMSPEEISVYMLCQDGTCQDIIEVKERLIEVEKIDAVSGQLNEEFDRLLSIEFNSDDN